MIVNFFKRVLLIMAIFITITSIAYAAIMDYVAKKINVEMININDDIASIKLWGSKPFDDEGNKELGEIPVELIDNNTLKYTITDKYEEEFFRMEFIKTNGESVMIYVGDKHVEMLPPGIGKRSEEKLEVNVTVDYLTQKVVERNWEIKGKNLNLIKIGGVVVSIAIAILFEVCTSIFMGIEDMKSVVKVNCLTQTLFCIYYYFMKPAIELNYYRVILPIVLMILGDTLLYAKMMKDKDPRRLLINSIIGNMVSFASYALVSIGVDFFTLVV